jgi:hypothetical protein
MLVLADRVFHVDVVDSDFENPVQDVPNDCLIDPIHFYHDVIDVLFLNSVSIQIYHLLSILPLADLGD